MYTGPHSGNRTPSTASSTSNRSNRLKSPERSAATTNPSPSGGPGGLKLSSKRSQQKLYKLKPSTATNSSASSSSSGSNLSSPITSPHAKLPPPSVTLRKGNTSSNDPTSTVSSPQYFTGSSEELVQLRSKAARSERKAMDLEISNSSLVTVNKFLEKKLYKQSLTIQNLEGLNSDRPPAVPEEENYDDEDGSNDENNNIPLDQLLNSDDIINQTGGMKAIEDEANKHIELVESFEKMNKSLQRCIYLSQTLLKDANRSLEYSVDPEDIKLGGRVVNHYHEDDDNSSDNYSYDSNDNDTIHE